MQLPISCSRDITKSSFLCLSLSVTCFYLLPVCFIWHRVSVVDSYRFLKTYPSSSWSSRLLVVPIVIGRIGIAIVLIAGPDDATPLGQCPSEGIRQGVGSYLAASCASAAAVRIGFTIADRPQHRPVPDLGHEVRSRIASAAGTQRTLVHFLKGCSLANAVQQCRPAIVNDW